jgi:flagellar basal-body rod protein FlgF
MLRCLYIAGTGMLVQRKKMDVLTNNITNAETTGFKQDNLLSRSFSDIMISRLNDPSGRSSVIGPLNTGVHSDNVITDFTQGSAEQTELLTDMALHGQGFFTVSTPQGERYTRDGSLSVSGTGYLTTSEGYPVQGNNGPVYVGTGKFAVEENGNVSVGGKVTDKLKIVSFQNPDVLSKEGSNLFSGAGATIDNTTTVKQGFIENSNVDIAEAMVKMIEVSRTYETNQRMVKMIDDSLGKAVNDVGRV